MGYRVDQFASGRTVRFDPGTSILVSGSTAAADGALLDVVGAAPPQDETAIVISATRPARAVVQSLRERDALVPGRVGIIDCTEGGGADEFDGVAVEQLASPGDLTGISLEFAKLVRGFDDAGDGDRVRVGLASISTLLMYTEVRTAFRFLHVFTSRIGTADMLGVFSLDPGMHDGQTTNTVRAIFNCEARADDGSVELRGSGFTVE